MIEEFMLLANCEVARHIEKEFPQCAVLRRHPSPPLTNFDLLVNAAAVKGIQVKCSTNAELAYSLENANIPGDPFFNILLRIVSTRCMMQAVYFCSGLHFFKQVCAELGNIFKNRNPLYIRDFISVPCR